jgi:hypothetical protein
MRKHTRRRPLPLVNPVELAMRGAALLTPDERRAALNPSLAAMADMGCGRGRGAQWRELADALNLSEALMELQIAPNLRPDVEAAQAALGELMKRAQLLHRWVLRGPEMTALRTGLWVYRVQLEHCTVGELERAVTTVRNRVAQALAGNAGPRTTVHQAPELAP